ncbi:MAG: T9SS type A sorting domain-containing protein, partial [Ignavibacteria bacterium]
DLDNDGDIDVLSSSKFDSKIAWYENSTNITSVRNNQTNVPNNFQLYQNYPNPFNPSTTISYSLPQAGQVTLDIYNLLGEKIETLVNEYQTEGEHQLQWKPEGLSSSIYFVRMLAGSKIKTIKLVLQK